MVMIKLSGQLHDEIQQDLLRRHPFACERVGFVLGRTVAIGGKGQLILLTRYLQIPDDEYLPDRRVSARIGTAAITRGARAAYHGRARNEGVFHVHIHDHSGRPRMSPTDARDIPEIVRGFRSIGQTASHGIVLLSRNSAAAWTWLARKTQPELAAQVMVIDNPLRLLG